MLSYQKPEVTGLLDMSIRKDENVKDRVPIPSPMSHLV